jgi:hypothetical protein
MNWALDFAAVDVARLEVRESTLLSKKMEALSGNLSLHGVQRASDVFFIGRCLFFIRTLQPVSRWRRGCRRGFHCPLCRACMEFKKT